MRRLALLLLWTSISILAQETVAPIIEQKNLEIYNLKAELEYYKQLLKNLELENKALKDSVYKKGSQVSQGSTQNADLALISKVLEEDRSLNTQILEEIRSGGAPKSKELIDDSTFTLFYNEALNQYFEGNYQKAGESFRNLVNARKDHPLSDNCQYWLAECYYARQKYHEALENFQKVQGLGDGNKADAALFKIGLTNLKLGRRSEALRAFMELETKFPESELVPKARQYIQQLERF